MIEKQPFVNYTLEDEKKEHNEKYGKPFTIRLNPEEQKEIDKLKALLDIKSDGTALKIGAIGYLHCITSTFSPLHLAWLFKKERARLSDLDDRERWLKEKL